MHKYTGIKIELPTQTITNASYIGLYLIPIQNMFVYIPFILFTYDNMKIKVHKYAYIYRYKDRTPYADDYKCLLYRAVLQSNISHSNEIYGKDEITVCYYGFRYIHISIYIYTSVQLFI
jgi:hypothetical protein